TTPTPPPPLHDALPICQIRLFDEGWLPRQRPDAPLAPVVKRDVFHEEMARINEAIRRDFFSNAMPYGDIIHEKALKYDVDPALRSEEHTSELQSRENLV